MIASRSGPGVALREGCPERPLAWPCSWSLLRWIEVGCLASGVALLAFFAGARLDSAISHQAGLAAFGLDSGVRTGAQPELAVDQSLWSPERIARYRESLEHAFAPPLAVLEIPRIGLEVAVWPGIDELTLNRGAGHIPGTAVPGEPGNVGIAGHRDGFFRGLKDIAVGDRLGLDLPAGSRTYVVASLEIVEPSAVRVLAPTPAPVLTLVTCYPFYFVGKAPLRFIVRAEALPAAIDEATAGTAQR